MFITEGRQGEIPEGMPPGMFMRRWFYKTYKWTPQEVNQLPLEDLIWLPLIEQAEGKATDYRTKQNQRTQSSVKKDRPIRGY
jgi:hypothetical protein